MEMQITYSIDELKKSVVRSENNSVDLKPNELLNF